MHTPLDRVDARLQNLQTKATAELAAIEQGRQFIETIAKTYGSRKPREVNMPDPRMTLVSRGKR